MNDNTTTTQRDPHAHVLERIVAAWEAPPINAK